MIPTLWSILHIWGHEFETPQQRALWLVLVVFLPCVGGIIYIFTGRKKVLGKVQN
ncbi:MAG: PLD nuclease N-terminal domain-containing protein [Desulfovibrio sp.]|nr:PLD nuclease N-terminal domain-containing protein [Desulfovibrio desulfuricans]